MTAHAIGLPPAATMTAGDFFTWTDGTDTHYELVNGILSAMAPPAPQQSRIAVNMAAELRSRLKRPCAPYLDASLLVSEQDGTVYQADLAVSCTQIRPDDQYVPDPVAVFEILSPETELLDLERKTPGYRSLASVQVIVLIASTKLYVKAWHRREDGWHEAEYLHRRDILPLPSIGCGLTLASIYEGVPL